MFPEPTELLLIGYSIESIWTPRSKSNSCWRQEPTRRHVDEGKFHTWWMESSRVFVQHQPFQSHQQSWSDVEKNTRRIRWRKSHSKVETDDEFGLAMQRKDSWSACLYCIRKPGWKPDMKVNYLRAHGMSSISDQGDLLRTLTHQVAQSGMLTRIGLLKSGNLMNWWKLEQGDLFMNNHPVCSHSTRTDLLLMTMIWTLTPPQNRKCR